MFTAEKFEIMESYTKNKNIIIQPSPNVYS